MTSATAKSSEPTIDDILASIRRIIADEQQMAEEPAPAARIATGLGEDNGEVLDLAQPVLRPTVAAKPVPVPESPPVADRVVSALRPKPVEPQVPAAPTLVAKSVANQDHAANGASGPRLERLIAGEAEEALAAAFGRISALKVSAETKTLEGLVADLLRPMLKEWLDANLPAIAERLVKQEIERIAAQTGR